jgi:YHS domain-containing protein
MRFLVRVSLVVAASAILAGGLVGLQSAASAQDAKKPEPAAPAKADAAQGKTEAVIPFFGNEKCPLTGKAINKTKFVESDGERVYFCCGKCMKESEKKKRETVAAAYKETIPVANKSCPVCGKAIEADKGKDVAWQGRKVMVCSAECVSGFKKSPFVYTTKAVYGAEDLANKKCPVMAAKGKDEAAGDDDLVVYKGKIVHFCCEDCPEDFVKDPETYFAKVK